MLAGPERKVFYGRADLHDCKDAAIYSGRCISDDPMGQMITIKGPKGPFSVSISDQKTMRLISPANNELKTNAVNVATYPHFFRGMRSDGLLASGRTVR
jgi:hypothetical protein